MPRLIVLHHTAMATTEAAVARLCDPVAEVSSHYVISPEGAVIALVDEARRAWHAGRSYWRGETDINSASIGIELANAASLDGFPPFPAPQMAALRLLLREVMGRWRIDARDVLGHSDIAPGRKADPGAKFDWDGLARCGLARGRPGPGAGFCAGAGALDTSLVALGYDPTATAGARAAAFELRWGPFGGPAAAAALASRLVDADPAGDFGA